METIHKRNKVSGFAGTYRVSCVSKGLNASPVKPEITRISNYTRLRLLVRQIQCLVGSLGVKRLTIRIGLGIATLQSAMS